VPYEDVPSPVSSHPCPPALDDEVPLTSDLRRNSKKNARRTKRRATRRKRRAISRARGAVEDRGPWTAAARRGSAETARGAYARRAAPQTL